VPHAKVLRFVRGAALLVIAIALADLAGWYWHFDVFIRVFAGLPAMVPNSALASLCAAVALLLASFGWNREPLGGRLAFSAAAGVALAIGTLTIAEYIGVPHIGLDSLLPLGPAPAMPGRLPGRPAFLAAAGLTLLSSALFRLDTRSTRVRLSAEVLAFASGSIGLAALAGYAFGAAALYGDVGGELPTGVSLPTAISLTILSAGVIAARPDADVMVRLLADTPGGRLTRVFVGTAAAAVGLALLSLLAERIGAYDRATASALPAVIAFLFATALVSRLAIRLDRVHANLEEALATTKESEAARRRLFDEAGDAIFVANLEGRYTDVNRKACEMLGYAREELLGKTIADLIRPEEVPRLDASREKMLAGSEQLEEWTLRRKDGTFVPVELTAKILPTGQWHAIVRDVSRRREAEERLARERAWLDAVIDQMPIGVLLVGVDGTRLAENRALVALASGDGTRTDPFGNRTRYDLRLPSKAVVAPEEFPLFRVLRGHVPAVKNEEFLVRQSDDSFIPILVDAGPVYAEDGTLLGGVTTVRNASAQKELERMREEWAAVVAHDLRQPVSAILASAGTLARGVDGETRARLTENVRNSAWRLERMIRDLLDSSRLEAERFPLDCREVELSRLVREIVDRTSEATKGHEVVVETTDAVEARVDPLRLEQILSNLLSNAAKYGEPGSPIRVRLDAHSDDVEISVTNHGPGIQPQELAHLFERFHRTEGARQSRVEGIGLGLYITRKLVEAHGGTIRVESVPGETTTFRIRIPRERVAMSVA